jgi:hypothetical protein
LESRPDTPVVGPQLHHQVTLHALHLLHRHLPQQLRLHQPAATADGVLTRAHNRLSNPVSRPDAAEGGSLECVPYHCGAVRMCACHGLEQGGTYRETLLRTLSGCRVLYSVSLGTGSLGLRDLECPTRAVLHQVSSTGRLLEEGGDRLQPVHRAELTSASDVSVPSTCSLHPHPHPHRERPSRNQRDASSP